MSADQEHQLRRDVGWNTASSIVGSLSMVLMLLVVTRSVGVYAAGLFSLATAAGQQLQTFGAYEVRPYQATDVRQQFSFGTYFSARILTTLLMAIGIVVYSVTAQSSAIEGLTIALVASLRLFDAFEDVFYGEFQRRGRLDVAAKANFLRVLVTMTSFILAIVISRNLLASTALTIPVSLIAMVLLILPQARLMFSIRPQINKAPLVTLLVSCFPLAIAAFLAMYIGNAPRFAIERYLDTESQGIYGILFMPALAINILVMFVFRPLLTRMANVWASSKLSEFRSLVLKGLGAVGIAFLVTFAVAYSIGIPILEKLYAVNLEGRHGELVVLVIGGGFNACAVVLYYSLATMRRQREVLLGYVGSSLLAFVLSMILVDRFGMMGASVAYTASVLCLMVLFALTAFHFIQRRT